MSSLPINEIICGDNAEKMARLMGRKYIGIEINPDYCEIARKRLAQKVFEFQEAST